MMSLRLTIISLMKLIMHLMMLPWMEEILVEYSDIIR